MKAEVMSDFDRAMLSKRYIIEEINDQLNNISRVEHSWHRSETAVMLNVISGLVVYCLNKTCIKLSFSEFFFSHEPSGIL